MQRCDRQSCGAIRANYAERIERLTHHSRESHELKNLNFGGYSCHVNQSGACFSSDVITCGGRKSETRMEGKVIVVECGYPELYIQLRTFTKTGIHFARDWSCLAEAPPMTRIRVCCVVNFTREWHEFHTRMKRVNSNVQASNYARIARFICVIHVWCERTLRH